MDIKNKLQNKFEEFINTISNVEIKNLIKDKSYFAGGAIRDLAKKEPPKDYDLYFYDEESKNKFLRLVYSQKSLKPTNNNNYNCQYTRIQVITTVYGKPDDLIEQFDFTINCGYYLPQVDVLKVPEETTNLIPCKKVSSPFNALIRIAKFTNRGYYLPEMALIQLGIMLSKLDPIVNEQQLKEHLKGMSTGSFQFFKEEVQISCLKSGDFSVSDFGPEPSWSSSDDIPF